MPSSEDNQQQSGRAYSLCKCCVFPLVKRILFSWPYDVRGSKRWWKHDWQFARITSYCCWSCRLSNRIERQYKIFLVHSGSLNARSFPTLGKLIIESPWLDDGLYFLRAEKKSYTIQLAIFIWLTVLPFCYASLESIWNGLVMNSLVIGQSTTHHT